MERGQKGNAAREAKSGKNNRVKRMLELDKKIDRTQQYMEYLKGIVEDGRANLSKPVYEKLIKYEASIEEAGRAYLNKAFYEERSKCEDSIKKRIRYIVENAPKYNRNPEKEFECCKNLENHLFNHGLETIPNEAMKRMLWSSIMDQLQG